MTSSKLSYIVGFITLILSVATGYAQTHSDVAFVPNEGQWDDFVTYRADLGGGVFWMEDDGWTAWLAGEGYDELWSHRNLREDGEGTPEALISHAWKVKFEGGSLDAVKSGSMELGHKVNYYVGNDPEKWATGLQPVKRVKYEGVWSRIDLVMDGSARGTRHLKYDWIVKPGGDVDDIAVIHEGTDLSLRPDGSLLHKMGDVGDVIEGVPFAYQLIGSKLVVVECEYILEHRSDGSSRVSFEVGDYDEVYDLVIDPDIVFATYIGATQANWGFTAGFDDDGLSITGAALWEGDMGTYPTTAGAISTTFAAGNGPFDIGISVFSADGTALLYSTIAGGNGMDVPSSIVADSNGDFYVFGTTGSSNFPVTAGAYDTGFNGGPNQA